MADISQISDGTTTWDIKDATARNSIANAITTAGTGLSKSGNTINHSNAVTAGTAGTSSATSGNTLAVPYVTYDTEGHITAAGTHTHNVPGTWYGTCSTAAGTAAKVVTCDGFEFQRGAVITIRFTYGNSVRTGVTLNINGTGAKTAATQSVAGLPFWEGQYQILTFICTASSYYLISMPSTLIGNVNSTATTANTHNLRSTMQFLLAASTMVEGKPAWDGHILDFAWNSNNKTGQLYVPNLQDGTTRPAWRAMSGTDDWTNSVWDYFYTDEHPPAFSDITGTADPAQLPVATSSTLGAVQPDGSTITVDGSGVISAAYSPEVWTLNATVDVSDYGEGEMLFRDGKGNLWDYLEIEDNTSSVVYYYRPLHLYAIAYTNGAWADNSYRMIEVLKWVDLIDMDTWLPANGTRYTF